MSRQTRGVACSLPALYDTEHSFMFLVDRGVIAQALEFRESGGGRASFLEANMLGCRFHPQLSGDPR